MRNKNLLFSFSFIIRLILALITSSIVLDIFVSLFLFLKNGISFSYFGVYFFFFLIFYTIFGLPVQVILNTNPKKFSLRYLSIYFLISILINVLLTFLSSTRDIREVIFTILISSLVFWIVDSIFTQNK
ncbi:MULTISPECIES: UPF0715 family protein [Bacillus]|uniref:UPF0715 family protein n=1 Tax=Bacillus TaxID=1386 RepID=UPI0013D0EF78